MNDLLAHLLHPDGTSGPLGILQALGLAAALLSPLEALNELINAALPLPLIGSLVAPVFLGFRVLVALCTMLVALVLLVLSQIAAAGPADTARVARGLLDLCRVAAGC